ncbi:MAG: Yip1 family protein [Pseudomonadota bacterium]
MNLVDRVKNILLQPQSEWQVIEPEQTNPQSLYTSYIMILALIPAVAGLVGTAFIASYFGGRIGLGFVLGAAIMQYVLSLVMVFVVAFIADLLAPGFDGQKNLNQALKLTAYAMTAAWVAGIFAIIPLLGWLLSLLGSLYSLYLFYLGVPLLMKVPAAKAVGYTVVVVLAAIIIGLVIGMINASILGMGAVGMMGGMR